MKGGELQQPKFEVGRQAEAEDVTRRLEGNQWCAIVAPRYSGKSTFAGQLLELVKKRNPTWHVVLVRFGAVDSLDQTWAQVLGAWMPDQQSPLSSKRCDGTAETLADIVTGTDARTTCLLLDDVDNVPDEVLRLFAGELRRFRNEQRFSDAAVRLRVTFFGAMKLHYLSVGDLSPLSGIIESISLSDLDADSAKTILFRGVMPLALDEAVERVLFEETAGHPYLVEALRDRVAESDVTALAIREAAKAWSDSCATSGVEADQCFRNIVKHIETHHRTFEVICQMLECLKREPTPRPGVDLVVLSGAVLVKDGRFVFRGKMLKRALGTFLDPLRKAECSCLHGDWPTAERYFQQVQLKTVRQRRRAIASVEEWQVIDL